MDSSQRGYALDYLEAAEKISLSLQLEKHVLFCRHISHVADCDTLSVGHR
jgi:hypothetical protein